MRALALEHLRPNPLGVYGDVLDERGIGVDRIMVDQGEEIPDWRAFDFIVVMGAAADVWDREASPWIAAEERVVRDAVLAGVPYFGVCFGAQLLATAFGAHSYRGVAPELGINQVFLTAAARRDTVFRGFPPDLEVCEWHSNHFTLPAGAVRLARSPRYDNQAIRLGRVAYGIQCHLETTREDLEAWLELFPHTLAPFEARHGAGSLPAFMDDYGASVPRLRETARQLFGRWLENGLVLGNLADAERALRSLRPREARPTRELIGREPELARIERAFAAARQGGSAVLVIRGDAGAGKSALLDDAVARARDLTVLRARGADHGGGEQRFAGLGELLAPLMDRREHLSAARAAALGSALGLEPPAATLDRYAVYAAALDLLTAVADETPILAVVDDAHLLDEASAAAISFLAASPAVRRGRAPDRHGSGRWLPGRRGSAPPGARAGARQGTAIRPIRGRTGGAGDRAARRDRARQPVGAPRDRARSHARAARRRGAARRCAASVGGVGVPASHRVAARCHAPGVAGRRAVSRRRPRDAVAGVRRPGSRPVRAPPRGAGRARGPGHRARHVLPRAGARRGLLLRPRRRSPPRPRGIGRRGDGGAAPVASGPRGDRCPTRRSRGASRTWPDARSARARTPRRRTPWSRRRG